MICAIIPARGGSKGVPRKNIAPFLGRPLIAHTIACARSASLLDRVVVSTDDQEIASIAAEAGAEVPFLRSPALAADDVPTVPVLQDAVARLEAEGEHCEAVVLLQPTSPLRRPEHIDAAVRKWRDTNADAVVSVCLVEHSPYWMHTLDGDRLRPLLTASEAFGRRQDLPPTYRLNGAVYVTRRDVLMRQASILGTDTRAVVMPQEASIDIDTPLDFRVGEWLAGAPGA